MTKTKLVTMPSPNPKLIKDRAEKQDAFLKAMAGVPK
jgi:hypothetical protein